MTASAADAPQPIVFARPSAQYRAHREEIDAAMRQVLEGQFYILGEQVKAFEAEFAAFCETAHGIGVANGTDALHLALRALEVGNGDEVIVTAHTAVATIAAIEMSGATPVFVDIDASRFCFDPAKVAAAIGPRTKAILAVHLYGHPADLGPLLALARRHGLKLIEDCAQAHGARWQGRPVGSIGDVGCFSLYPTKNLGAIGDAGIIVTGDAALAERLRLLRQYGWRNGQLSEIPGWNSRLDELQAAILRVKLKYLAEGNERRRAIARRYAEGLSGLPLKLPQTAADCQHVFHLYVVRCAGRDALKASLAAAGVIAGIHYPLGCHKHPAYAERFGTTALPVTERVVGDILSLPMYPELTDLEVDQVIGAVRGFYATAVAAE